MTTPSSLARTLVLLTDEKMRQYGMRVMTPAVKIQELLKTFESLNWSIIEIEEFQSEVCRLGNNDVTTWAGEAVSQWKAKHVEDIKGYTIDDTLAHELGHVIAHIVFSIPFDYVWVRGISKDDWIDKYYGGHNPESAGCVGTYYHNPDKPRMAFDGVKIKRVKGDDIAANEYVTILLSGCAGSEILRGVESPRSVIEIQKTYYGMSQDVIMAAGWVRSSSLVKSHMTFPK
jgi:hypothetical protein